MNAPISHCPWCGQSAPVVATETRGRSQDGDNPEADDYITGTHIYCPQCQARGPLATFLIESQPPIERPPGLAYMQSPRERAMHLAIEEWNRIACRPWWVRAWRNLQRRKG